MFRKNLLALLLALALLAAPAAFAAEFAGPASIWQQVTEWLSAALGLGGQVEASDLILPGGAPLEAGDLINPGGAPLESVDLILPGDFAGSQTGWLEESGSQQEAGHLIFPGG